MHELLSDPAVWTSALAFAAFLAERFFPAHWMFFNAAAKVAKELLILHDVQQKRNDTLATQAESLGLEKAAKALRNHTK